MTKYPLIIVFWVTLGYNLDHCIVLTQYRTPDFASGRHTSMGCVSGCFIASVIMKFLFLLTGGNKQLPFSL